MQFLKGSFEFYPVRYQIPGVSLDFWDKRVCSAQAQVWPWPFSGQTASKIQIQTWNTPRAESGLLGWIYMKKKAKRFKNNPVPMPRSDDAGWIIHRELFVQRMRLAFMLNKLLASFDFLFHYSPRSVPLKLQPLRFWKSLSPRLRKGTLGKQPSAGADLIEQMPPWERTAWQSWHFLGTQESNVLTLFSCRWTL